MHPSVSAAWPVVAREHEGVLPFMYLDTVGKVTAGIGTLLDDGNGIPPESYLALPWTTQGREATRAEKAAGWLLVKSRTDLAPRGGSAFRDITTLRLDDRTIDGLLTAKTREFWSILASQLVDLERWPADAQLALIDCAYQGGPRFLEVNKPGRAEFRAAAHAGNFEACALHCANPNASAERNRNRARWFANAADVVEYGLDRARLWDEDIPEQEDDMPLNDADKKWIRDTMRAELKAALPLVWNSPDVDMIDDGAAAPIRPATALERILERAR